jgi:membrane-associated phospholipid phosphatase
VGLLGSRWVRAATGVAMVSVSLQEARKHDVADIELRAFRIANDAPDALRTPVRTVMQAGTFVTVPIVAAVAAVSGRRRLAVELATGGTLAWLGAKALKRLGGRGRPGALLPDVRVRESIGGDLGWVSGHTAVATTLAAIAWPHAPRSARPALVAVVATTAFGRMYVGAHLPLDLVGGAGFGLVVSAIAGRSVVDRSEVDQPGVRRLEAARTEVEVP